MLSIFDGIRELTFLSVALRLLIAFLCGAIIGLERSYKNRPAGLRTHILICVGASVASMTGLYLYLRAGLPTDVSRLGASVVSGLGFIGAGTIIVTKKHTIKGLTTAAGLWASGIIGLAVGAGYYEGGIAATILVLLTETVIGFLSDSIPHTQEFRITLRYHEKPALDQVLRYCKDQRLSITNLHVVSDGDAERAVYIATVSLRPRRKVSYEKLLSRIRQLPGLLEADRTSDAEG